MSLAKVGNPTRDEALQTSKSLCTFGATEADVLTTCFLKPFRSLELHHFHHHVALESNEVYNFAASIFDNPDSLLENGESIARHLYTKSTHPNIKSGDLCIALIKDIVVDGETTNGISIVKSESKVPFLQISVYDGDLKLTTQRGIYPDKIDKGCLIINHSKDNGFLVYMFDKGGATPHFWNRDFLGVAPRHDDDYLTKRYTELCVAFAEEGLPEEAQQEERLDLANKTISYLTESENFDIQQFKDYALKDPEVVEKFDTFKSNFEEEKGQSLDDQFTVAKPVAEKARRRLKGKIKTDTGAQVYFNSKFINESSKYLQRGFDDSKQMHFLKIYYNQEEE